MAADSPGPRIAATGSTWLLSGSKTQPDAQGSAEGNDNNLAWLSQGAESPLGEVSEGHWTSSCLSLVNRVA